LGDFRAIEQLIQTEAVGESRKVYPDEDEQAGIEKVSRPGIRVIRASVAYLAGISSL